VDIVIKSFITGQTKRTINTYSEVFSLKLLNNKIHLAAELRKDINIYNINDGKLVSTLKGHSDWDLVQISDSVGDLDSVEVATGIFW
jgi:WD40 repeat protein